VLSPVYHFGVSSSSPLAGVPAVNGSSSGEYPQDKTFFFRKHVFFHSPVILMEGAAYFYLLYQHFFLPSLIFFG
jgi:hypothetical protein